MLTVASWDEVLHSELVEGLLWITSPLPAEGRTHRLELEDHPGLYAEVMIRRSGDETETANMMLRVHSGDAGFASGEAAPGDRAARVDPPGEDERQRDDERQANATAEPHGAITHLYVGPQSGQVTLGRDEHAGPLLTNVNLTQLATAAHIDGQAVRLRVSRVHAVDDALSGDVVVEAEDFASLARDHRELFDDHVRPMLLEIGLGGVLDDDLRRTATQVFLADLPVDEETDRRVRGLVADLDAAEFATRHRAQQALAELGRAGMTALARIADREELSPEQSARVEAVLGEWRTVAPERARELMEDKSFLREVAGLRGGPEDEELRRLAEKRLAERE